MPEKNDQYLAWAEIDLKALRHNFREIKKLSKPRGSLKAMDILAVIKADAYGHGMTKTAQVLGPLGVSVFGVSDLQEGLVLRKNGIKKPILLFESSLPSHARQMIDYNLMPTVCTMTLASALNTYAKSINRKVKIHIKVDTGMSRLGVWHTEAMIFIRQISKLDHVVIDGVYTHFPVADSDPNYTKRQILQFKELMKILQKEDLNIPWIHAANSMGLAGYRTELFNLVRPGLMLYGLYPSPKLKSKIFLKPAMAVKARIIFVKDIPKGTGVSYGHTFVAQKNMSIATLPIGYSDGYLRSFSNKAQVLIKGKLCPVIGRVTMDQVMVDVSSVKNSSLGDVVVVMGKDGKKEITAEDLAERSDTINYEVACNLGNQLPRVYKS